jgi:hypothetical protein
VGDEELDKSSLNVGDGVGLEVLTIVLFWVVIEVVVEVVSHLTKGAVVVIAIEWLFVKIVVVVGYCVEFELIFRLNI